LPFCSGLYREEYLPNDVFRIFEYMTTLGNSEKGVSARKRIVNSLIGLAIVLIAAGIVQAVGKAFKG
jgi:ABC-type polysaccharide transport system permease subunit